MAFIILPETFGSGLKIGTINPITRTALRKTQLDHPREIPKLSVEVGGTFQPFFSELQIEAVRCPLLAIIVLDFVAHRTLRVTFLPQAKKLCFYTDAFSLVGKSTISSLF